MPQQSNPPKTVPKSVLTEAVRCLSGIDVYSDYSDYFEDQFPGYNSIFYFTSVRLNASQNTAALNSETCMDNVSLAVLCTTGKGALTQPLPVSPACCRSCC